MLLAVIGILGLERAQYGVNSVNESIAAFDVGLDYARVIDENAAISVNDELIAQQRS